MLRQLIIFVFVKRKVMRADVFQIETIDIQIAARIKQGLVIVVDRPAVLCR